MEAGRFYLQMEIFTLENGTKARRMVREFMNFQIEINMKDILNKK